MYKLFARPGWGSVLVETQLTWYGLEFELEEVENPFTSENTKRRLEPINPLIQLPTLLLPDGSVMTESAAITLHLADVTGSDDLVPGADSFVRPDFLRWLIFFVANIYPTFTYGDAPERFVADPAAQQAFRTAVDKFAYRLWTQVSEVAGRPWFLGERFSALDIYLAAMTRWRPGRDFFSFGMPRLHDIAASVDALPQLAAVWQRNFPPQPQGS